ncbi:helix-turn-helix transcriptional regulator [Streptomyces sp. NPDC050617]|uniref:helix-turn-helix domain-containing protein n=1 Tax=Streptomyces sp. NPDC050617 TaxID=3154628 RepID=UPI0034221ACE
MTDRSDFPDEMPPGERIQRLRERRGMSRPVLAGLCGRGPDWLKGIEKGKRQLRDHGLLVRVATALRVSDLSVITGELTPRPVTAGARLMLPGAHGVRDAIRGSLFSEPSDGAPEGPPSVDVLRGRVAEAWRLWHTSRFQRSEVSALLAGLIQDAQTLPRRLEGPERRRAYAVLADVYHLAQQVTAYAVEPELYWVIADRGRRAAQDADDPLSLSGAAWAFGNGLRETGYAEEAIQVVEQAAEAIRPQLDGAADDLRGMFGALHLHAAITCAREGRDGDAWRHWDEADRTAARLPDGYVHSWTVFGRANTDFHAVSIGVDLRTPGSAMNRAEAIDLDAMPSVERRSRVLVELARAQRQRRDQAGALHWMRRAVAASPETVRYTPSARTLISDLAKDARGPLKSDAAQLADEVGVLTA